MSAVYPSEYTNRHGIIDGVTLEGSVILGPAIFILLGHCTIAECSMGMEPSMLDSYFYIVDEGMHVGCIGLRNCTIIDCEFKSIGWMGTGEQIIEIKQALFGTPWDLRGDHGA